MPERVNETYMAYAVPSGTSNVVMVRAVIPSGLNGTRTISGIQKYLGTGTLHVARAARVGR